MAQIILTSEQRREITTIPYNISDDDLLTYCAFDEDDIRNITNGHKDLCNRIGYAVQLFHLRYLGWNYTLKSGIPSKVLNFIAKQINASLPRSWNFKERYKRPNTIIKHFHDICLAYGYRQMDEKDEEMAMKIISTNADVVENREFIIREIISALKVERIVLPKISTIEKWVQDICNRKEADLNRLIYSMLTSEQCSNIKKAILCKGTAPKSYNLHQLRNVPGKITPESFCEIADRIEYIDSLNLDMDLSSISHNKRKSIARRIVHRRLYSIERSSQEKIYPGIVIYIHETRKMLLDFVVESNDAILHNLLRKSEKRNEKTILQNSKEIFKNQSDLLSIAEAVSFSLRHKKNLRTELKKRNFSSLEALDLIIKRGYELNCSDSDSLELLNSHYSQIRKYSPRLLKILKVTSESEEMTPLVKAVDCLRKMNLSDNLKLPDDAPLNHIENKWIKLVQKDGCIDKRYYEMATLSSLRHAIRNNLVTVEGSEKYLAFEQDLIDKETHKYSTDVFDVLNGFETFDEYLSDRKKRMTELLDYLSDNIDLLDDLWIDKGSLHLSPLGTATPENAMELSKRIFKGMIPEARLEEILLEVDKWVGFTKYFIHRNLKNQTLKEAEKEKVLAALMALGTNVGLVKMSQAMGKYSYDQLYSISQNCLDDDNLVKAQGEVVRLLRSLWVSEYWGEGNTSSSDGRGIRSMVSSFNAEPNPRHGIDKGCTIYRFVCDKYYVFFTKVIRTNSEFQHVIDGVLAHELMVGEPVIEHYTDTGGYSDPLFGLAHLLGFAYAPRMKNVSSRNLFIFKDNILRKNIEGVAFKKIQTDWIKDYYDEILRIAYSIKKGHVSGELVMRKLCNKSSHLRRAIVEMGRIEKTLFLLRYFTSKELKRKIQIGLNKGEANNSLAKAVQFGQEGKFTTKNRDRQQVRASALSLIMDVICLWNAVYLQRSVEYIEANDKEIDKSLLKHISPQNYEHITFLGHYDFDSSLSLGVNEYRKLKVEENI